MITKSNPDNFLPNPDNFLFIIFVLIHSMVFSVDFS